MLSKTFVLLLLGAGSALPAQFDDAMWFASRQGRRLTKVNACGEVLASADLSGNGLDLDQVARAPDGRLWVLNFITTRMTITDRNGGNLVNIDTTAIDPVRGASGIVFDRNGIAWVTFNAVARVARFAPSGLLLNTIPVPAFPLEITVDNQGSIWVGHRSGPPSTITKIDPTTFASQSFALPNGTRTLGGFILADSPGISGASRIWTCGDNGNEVVVFDVSGNHQATYFVGASSTVSITALTLDGAGQVWVIDFRSNPSVYRLDRNTGAVLHRISDPPEPVGLATDSFGRVWYINRISFSGPAEAEARRADPTANGTYEVNARIGIGAYDAADPNGFHRAFVVMPLADFDGDGTANIIEIQTGSSPYDPQSTPSNTLLTAGPTRTGRTAQIEVRGSVGPAVLGLATGAPAATTIPGIAGQLRLNPSSLLGFTVSVISPTTIPITIPTDPTLVGFVLRMQALKFGATPAWSNDSCLAITN